MDNGIGSDGRRGASFVERGTERERGRERERETEREKRRQREKDRQTEREREEEKRREKRKKTKRCYRHLSVILCGSRLPISSTVDLA